MAGKTSPTRKWLLTHPRPARVRVHVTGEATPRELVCLQGGASWAKCADTIDAFSPRLIEALDAAGAVLRATSAEQLAEAAEAPADEASAPRYAEEDPTAPLAGDSELETFARLLERAHEVSGERAMHFVSTAFDKIVEIANVQSTRLERMQTLVDSMHRRFMSQAAAAGGDDETPADAQGALLAQMIGQFMAGQSAAAAKANGVNGAGHGKGDG